eukprot:SAG11_NODE_24661_length_370_cov_0.549815_1_plen_35_part_01
MYSQTKGQAARNENECNEQAGTHGSSMLGATSSRS